MRSTLDFVSLADHGLDAAAELLTRAFADYFVKIAFTAPGLLQLARVDSVDLAASQIVRRDGVAVGAALIARRGWTSRLAGMGLLPEARRGGVGRALMEHLLRDAEARGEHAMTLEVIEQNEAAVKLYERCGFEKLRRLVGFSGSGTAIAKDALQTVDLRVVGHAVSLHGSSDLPWQLSGETIAQLGPPDAGYSLSDAWLALSGLAGDTVSIRAWVATPGRDAIARQAAVLRAAMAKHPQKTWRATAVWPEELNEAFNELGLARLPLTQWQMVRALR
ncbi:MAG TPA: GNAT family N-acetyltransferase [Opitutus sp.]|nr:GNAT family N-acetyltransferase [Opitutus sp.]